MIFVCGIVFREVCVRAREKQTNRSVLSWMAEGKRAFKAGFRKRRNVESLERL